MATYTFDKIEYGGNIYVPDFLPLVGGTVTGPVTFGDTITVDNATLGSLTVSGSASVANNLQVNTINGVTVGNSPKFTDTIIDGVGALSKNGNNLQVNYNDGTAVRKINSINATTVSGISGVSILYDNGGDGGAVFLPDGNGFYTGSQNIINQIPSITLNGSSSTSPSFYAPTSAGTSGYYLKSNGSGAPTWTAFPTIPDVSGKIDTAGTGLSKSGTTLNHSNSVTAQTTQAVYPIKIDAQGHISAYGSAVTIPTVPSNIVNTITTTAGAHTAISSQKGNVSFNVPTKTSHLTNDSGFLTSHQDISGKADKATTLAGYGITDAKIASGTITLGSNTITPLTSSSTLNAAKLSGAIPSAVTATTQASTDNSTKIATTAYVTTAIASLPEPMVFKGSVGTDGTITSLPTAAAVNEGWTYKVITALTTPVTAKVGDTVISNGSAWTVIPSGDEPSGTVTSVGISNGGGLSVSGGPITSSGTITVSHADTSSQASSSNSGRTYIQSITLDTYGHVTGLSTATETVTDTNTHRPIQMNGTEILGNNTTALNLKAGTNVSLSNSSGTVTIAATDTTYESKAAASGGTAVSLVTTGEKYTWNNKSNLAIGTTATTAAAGNHTHTTSIATSSATNQITLAYGTKYAITAGGTSYVFTMPSSDNTNTTYTFANGTNGFTVTPSGGSAQTVTVTPSITNNVTGSGTSGQLAQWNGTNTLTNGPKITYSTSAPSGGSNGDIWFVYS